MAARLSDPERKVFLLSMAQAWGNLADRLEKITRATRGDGFTDPSCEAPAAGT
jgi:hypothetical protein